MANKEPISSATDESLALSLACPKTAALYYDRVWDVSGAKIPESVGFTAETEFEAEASLLLCVLGLVNDLATGPGESWAAFDKWSLERVRDRTSIMSALEKCDLRISRKLTDALRREYHTEVVPVYGSTAELNREYELGEYAVIVPMLHNLQVVSEEKLRWDQVLEFRKDDEARVKFRRLAHWLDKEMVGRPRSFIEDAIEKRISDYQDAIKKHGLNAIRGSL